MLGDLWVGDIYCSVLLDPRLQEYPSAGFLRI